LLCQGLYSTLYGTVPGLGEVIGTEGFTLPLGGSDAVAAGEGFEKPSLSHDLPSPLVPRDPPGGRVKAKLTLPRGGSDAVAAGEGFEKPSLSHDLPSLT